MGLVACGDGGDESPPDDGARATAEAKHALAAAKNSGADLSAGPCISESLPGLPDWVADVAHDPRRPVDEDPANQCRRYRDGEAHHFVELNQQGVVLTVA